jgi:hypothetical protein
MTREQLHACYLGSKYMPKGYHLSAETLSGTAHSKLFQQASLDCRGTARNEEVHVLQMGQECAVAEHRCDAYFRHTRCPMTG